MTRHRRGDTNCDGFVRIAIMGDSYISGEGAYGYLPGTDEHGDGQNICHRSPSTLGRAPRGHRGVRRDLRPRVRRASGRRATASRSWPAAAR